MTNQEAIGHAADILDEAVTDVKLALVAPEHSTILLGLTSSLGQQINRLRFLSGTASAGSSTIQTNAYPPITEFMGEKLSLVQPITAEDFTPAQAERQAFIAKVEKLYKEFTTLPADNILLSYTTVDDQLVLRGVAKRAGLPDFGTAEIDMRFIESIITAITAKNQLEAEQARIDADLAKQTRITEINERLTDVTRVRDELTADITGAQADSDKAPANKKAKDKVANLQEEIDDADKLIARLQEELATLNS